MREKFFIALQSLLNRYIALDPESSHRIQKLKEKTAEIRWKTIFPFPSFFLTFDDNMIHVLTHTTEKPDILIQGTPLSLLHMSLSKNKKPFFKEDVTIEGNLELGQYVIDLFDQIEIDWEEHLSTFIGDVPAHHIGRFLQKIKKTQQRVHESVLRNVNEYVHEEADFFPPSEALNDFFTEVDETRMAVDRLEARVEKLKRSLE